MESVIRHRWHFNHAPERVWEFLTRPDLMAQWLMKTDFAPVLGHEFTFQSRPMPEHKFDGIFHCKVLEIEPARKLVYTWRGGPGDGTINLDSRVSWSLQPKDGGTDLLLEHTGVENAPGAPLFAKMDGGWFQNIQKIDALLTSPS